MATGRWQGAVTVGLSSEVMVLVVKWSEMPDDSEKKRLAMQPGVLAVTGGSVLPGKKKWLLTARCDMVADINEVFFAAMHISLLVGLLWGCLE